MKRIALLLLLLLTFTGCSLAPKEYLSITPHVKSSTAASTSDAITVNGYLGLKNAIMSLVRTGQTEGIIHAVDYDGVVTDDLAEAAYEVSKLDPLGAYAVDYMTHSCAQIVSYHEIRINITFRRTAQELAEIRSIATQSQLEDVLESAVDHASSRLTLRLSSYREQDQDIPAFIADYCAANPGTVMEVPAVSISVYPESGTVRILEIDFTYTNGAAALAGMRDAVQESIDGAAEYIRYRESDLDKAQLLYTYLTERFSYHPDETVTPLFDALCAGVADDVGLSQAWQLICDRAGVECYTVSGLRSGEAHTWNIISADGYYRHLDLAACMLELGALTLWDDTQMGDYYWSSGLAPDCEPLPEPELPAEPETPMEETPSTETAPPAEETPPEADPEPPTEAESDPAD